MSSSVAHWGSLVQKNCDNKQKNNEKAETHIKWVADNTRFFQEKQPKFYYLDGDMQIVEFKRV